MADRPARHREHEALQRLASRFDKLAASIPENFWMWDPSEPEPWYSSPAAERIFGFSREEGRRNPQLMLECIHPEDQPRVLPVMLGRFREPYDLEYRIVRPDGEVRWVRSRSFPTLGDDGELVNIAGITEDVTKRKEAAEALAEAERLAGLGRWDVHFRDPGEFQNLPGRWSDEMYRICGFAPGEIEPTGRRFLDLVHPDDRSRARQAMTAAICEGRAFDVKHRIVRGDGEVRHVHGRGRRDRLSASPPLFRMVGTLQDVTDSERAQRALRDSERRYRELFDGIPLGVYRSIPEGSFEDANPAFLRMFGATDLESVRRLGAGGLYADPAKRDELRTVLAEQGVVQAFEIDLRRLDGSVFPASVSARATRGADGEVSRYEGIVEDVSLRRAMEEDLRRARDAALRSESLKSAFLANMSHEIRTPLNVILGFASLVADHLRESGDHSQDQFIGAMQRAGKRLTATIHGILDISRFEAKGFEVNPLPVDLAGAIDRQLQEFGPLAAQRGLRLVAEIDARSVVRVDEYCLSQALANLIDNAIKFTGSGQVSVRLRPGDDGSLLLEVADTGVGIDAAFLPRLFDAFSQEDSGSSRHFEGSGLGLALAKNYLESNGASIGVESEKGRGSTFRIRFPPDLLVSAREAPAAP